MNFREEWMKTGRILTESENMKKNQTKLKNILTEMKDTLEGINSRLNDTGNWIGKPEDRVAEMTEVE